MGDLQYRAKIKAKGLDNTGVTEAIARRMGASLGRSTLLLIEVEHDTSTVDSEGNQQVSLAIRNVEPIPEAQEPVMRRFMRALFGQRPDQEGQAVLTGTDAGERPDDVASEVDAHIVTDDAGEPDGVWDGDTEGPLGKGPVADPFSPEGGGTAADDDSE